MKTGFLREIGNMGRRGRRLGTFDLRRFSKEKTQAGKGSPVSGSSVDLFGGQPRARGTGVVYLRRRETGFLTRPGEGASRAIRIGLPWVSLGALFFCPSHPRIELLPQPLIPFRNGSRPEVPPPLDTDEHFHAIVLNRFDLAGLLKNLVQEGAGDSWQRFR